MSDNSTKKTLSDCIAPLSEATTNTIDYFSNLEVNDLQGHLQGYKDLSEGLDQIESLIKILNEIYGKLQTETIPALFERHNIEGMKFAGRNFIPVVKFYASIPHHKKEQGYEWLKAQGLGQLIQPNVNAQTLSSALRELFEEKAILPPEDAISTHRKTTIQMRKT